MYSQNSLSTSGLPGVSPNLLSSPLMSYTPSIRHDEKGRQIQYVETEVQRRERMEFIRKREWARRVSAWIQESQSGDDYYHQDLLYDSAMSAFTTYSTVTTDGPSIPSSEDYYDDHDGYIIYSSSPSSPSSSTSTLTEESISPSSSPTSCKPWPRRSPRPTRRHPSLSSINEEPEED